MVNLIIYCFIQLWPGRCVTKDTRQIAPLKSTERRQICGFNARKRRISAQGSGGSVVCGQMEMDSHADAIACGSNCVIMHCTGRECDVTPCTETHEPIKSAPIVQAATAYDNPETGETTILMLNEAMWMGDKMTHTLVNPNQLRAHGITVQDNPFSESPIYVSTGGHVFIIPLTAKGTTLGSITSTPPDQQLQVDSSPHFSLSSAHE